MKKIRVRVKYRYIASYEGVEEIEIPDDAIPEEYLEEHEDDILEE